MDDLVIALEGTLLASINRDLKKFITRNQNTKFLIVSDYCLDDKFKPNKVASFTIIPYDFDLSEYTKRLQKMAPRDLKRSRKVNESFVEHISEKRIFSVSFVFENLQGLTQGATAVGKDFINPRIDNTISMIKVWIKNQPDQKEYYKSIIKKLIVLKANINSKSPNLNLYRYVVLIPLLAGYLAYLLSKEANAEIVGWFSDRDKIVDAWNGVALDGFALNHNAFCERNGLESSKTKIVMGASSASDKKLWSDEFNRIPDHLAGALASWDMSTNLCTQTKHMRLMEGCFADNDFCSIFKVNIEASNYQFSRVVVTTSN